MQNDIVEKQRLDIHHATVCFFVKQAQAAGDPSWVYLAIKGDKVGKGFRNGYGGHIEADETPRKCAAREVYEESGGVIVDPRLLRYVALGEFITHNDDGTKTVFKVKFFLAEKWRGEFRDTPKMFGGKWYRIDDLPLNPAGIIATREWMEKLCAYCEKNGIRLVNDSAYSMLVNSEQAVTLTDVAVNFPGLNWGEMFSASKAGNNTGWRIGAVVGSPEFMGDIKRINGNMNSGPVAAMAIGALELFEKYPHKIAEYRDLYHKRLIVLRDILHNAGSRSKLFSAKNWLPSPTLTLKVK
jgi:ADP-ribose pyrophosphatase YjhB (NUDIX family)